MKHKSLVYALLFLCFLSCARQPQIGREAVVVDIPEWFDNDSLRVAYLYSEGVKIAAMAEDRTEALPYFEKVFEIDSLHAPSHYQVGDMVVNEDSERGFYHGQIAYAADSTNVDYLGLYGYALLGLREVEKARGVYERLVRLEPHNAYNYQVLASLYKASKMPYMALSILDSAEYKLGLREDIMGQKLNILYSMNLYDRAIEEIKKELSNNPRNTERIVMLGYLYVHTKQDSLAESTFKEALALSPQSRDALLGLATLYKQMGQEAEMLQALKNLLLSDNLSTEEAVSIIEEDLLGDKEFLRRNFFAIKSLITTYHLKHSDDQGVIRCYAEFLVGTGEIEQGLELYKQLSREWDYTPNDDWEMVLGGEEYLGRADSVMHYINLSIENHPELARPYLLKGYEILRLGGEKSVAEARKLFKKALKLEWYSKDKSDIYCNLASLETSPQKRIKLFKKALQEYRYNATALNNWAYELCEMGEDLELALEMSSQACEEEPSVPTYLDTKAWILFKMGDIQEAKKIMRQAISLDDSGDSTFLLHYGDILAAEGDVFMAEIYYKRALEAGEEAEIIEQRIEALKR